MEDRETARMRKYGESKTTRIMMATVPHVTSGLGLRKFQADGFLLTRVYNTLKPVNPLPILEAHISILLHPDEQDYGSSIHKLFKVLQLFEQVLILA